MGLTENLPNSKVEEAIRVDRFEHHGDIGALMRASDADNVLIGANQTAISRHHGQFTNYFHSFAKDT